MAARWRILHGALHVRPVFFIILALVLAAAQWRTLELGPRWVLIFMSFLLSSFLFWFLFLFVSLSVSFVSSCFCFCRVSSRVFLSCVFWLFVCSSLACLVLCVVFFLAVV